MTGDSRPIFLLGAGFSFDANPDAEPLRVGSVEIAYPLAADLARRCFGLDSPPPGRAIEELFQKSQDEGNLEPMRLLSEALFWADHRIAARLVPRLGASSNACSSFFQNFDASSFLTYNYDSLPEIFLFHMGAWYPHDGYGTSVDVGSFVTLESHSSRSLVLHLHGSLCIHSSEYSFSAESIPMLRPRGRARFSFDPDSIGSLFPGFRKPSISLGFRRPPGRRVIAPIPEKADELSRPFIRAMYERACSLLESSDSPLVSIGFSFNPHDRDSYDPLLRAAISGQRSVLIVSPDAVDVSVRISKEYQKLKVQPRALAFSSWVRAGFPGL